MDEKNMPMVSIILPVLNEAEYIENCIRSLMNNNYERDKIEILVYDGGSSDNTREIITRLSREYPGVQLLDNPKKYIAPAFNDGIKIARGRIIIRFDGHAEATADFIKNNIEVMEEHSDAWCVGGPVNTVSKNRTGKIIAAVMTCPVGVGNAGFRLGEYDGYVDGVMYGAYKTDELRSVGPVDEFLLRTEDDDLHFRIRQAGGKCYMSSKISSFFYCRGSFRKLWSQYFQYGFWRVPTTIKHNKLARVRQAIPMLFVLGWFAFILGGLFWRPLWYGLAIYASLYIITLLLGAILAINKKGFAAGVFTPLVFPILHFGYGLGTIAGIWRFLIMRDNIPTATSQQ